MGKVESGSLEGNWISSELEQCILASSVLRLSVLPALGGKIASIQLLPSGEELLQQPLKPYAARTRYMSFDASDASGWDECLPSVAACEVQTASGIASIPDHGDFWQTPWDVISQNGNELTMSADGFSLPLRFSKALQLDGNCLRIAYEVRNLGKDPLEYVWSAHPLFAVEPGDRIVLPESVTEVIVEGSAQNRLGKRGTKQRWPNAVLTNHEVTDLSLTGRMTDGIGDKLFVDSPKEGWCAIDRSRLARRIELRFNPKELAYLGLWICYGGWPENAVNRQQCVALESCTADADSLATATEKGRARHLAPGTQDHWSLELRVGSVL